MGAAPLSAAEALPTSPRVMDIVANRRWLSRAKPFPHVVVDNLFADGFYRALEHQFLEMLRRRPQALPSPGRDGRDRGQQDMYAMMLPPNIGGPLAIFLSKEWHDTLAGLFAVPATGDIECLLHSHPVGSGHGWIHNDLWAQALESDAPDQRRKTVRAAAVLFYLGNPPWSPEDGGETGLYARPSDPPGLPVVAVPPVNNSLLAFECTPFSWHGYLSNRRSVRNSIVFWIHRSWADAAGHWGGEALRSRRFR